jgi:hypothetical protein
MEAKQTLTEKLAARIYPYSRRVITTAGIITTVLAAAAATTAAVFGYLAAGDNPWATVAVMVGHLALVLAAGTYIPKPFALALSLKAADQHMDDLLMRLKAAFEAIGPWDEEEDDEDETEAPAPANG